MKQFRFRLQNVLRYKRQLLDEALSELSVLQYEIYSVDVEITDNEAAFAENNRQMDSFSRKGASPAEIGSYRSHLDRLNRKGKELEAKKQTLLEKEEQKKAQILELKKDIARMEKLEDRQYGAYLQEAHKAQERELEEFLLAAALQPLLNR